MIQGRKRAMQLSWHGQSCVQIITTQGLKIIIDPFITGNPLSELDADKIESDVIIVTHAHSDHVGDTEAIAKRTNALVISTVEIADYFAERGLKTHGMQPGGGYQFDFGYIKLTPAIHGSAYPINGMPYTLGIAAGVLLHVDEKTIYHAGDTALFSDMKLIGETYPIDVAFLPIGDNYTMGPTDAARAVALLNPKKAVPIHYNTFPLIEQNPEDFISLLGENQGLILNPGEAIKI